MCVITLLKKHMPIFKLTNLHNIKSNKKTQFDIKFPKCACRQTSLIYGYSRPSIIVSLILTISNHRNDKKIYFW